MDDVRIKSEANHVDVPLFTVDSSGDVTIGHASVDVNIKGATVTVNGSAVGSGSGDVVGPVSAVADHLVTFNGTTGKLVKDGGAVPVITSLVTGPASATNNHLAVFDGTTGKLVKDGGAAPSATSAPAGEILFGNSGGDGVTSDARFAFDDGELSLDGDLIVTGSVSMDDISIDGTISISGHQLFIKVEYLTYTAAFGSALSHNTGSGNTACGHDSLSANTSGYNNTAVGSFSLTTNATGHENTGVGANALFYSIGSYNVAVGAATLSQNSSGSYNVAIGSQSLSSNTTGDNNVAIGSDAGSTLTTGHDNILIGNGVTTAAADSADQLNIGNLITGNMGVGTKTAAVDGPLTVNGAVTASDFIMSGSSLKTDTTDGHTGVFQAYDVDGAAYKTFATLTNGNTPSLAIAPPAGGTVSVDATTFKVAGVSGADASIVIPLLGTITVSKGIITSFVPV